MIRGRNRGPKRPQLSRILIVCEDSVNSVSYLKALCSPDDLNLDPQRVVIKGSDQGSAPISVIDSAIEKFKAAEKEGNEFDRAFVLIDRDSHSTYSAAINKAEANKISIIFCNPCFELWILLHFECSSSPMNGDDVIKRIKKYLPDFNKKGTEKKTDYGKLYKDILRHKKELAISNAKSLFKQSEKSRSINPLTNIFELIEYLEQESNRA